MKHNSDYGGQRNKYDRVQLLDLWHPSGENQDQGSQEDTAEIDDGSPELPDVADLENRDQDDGQTGGADQCHRSRAKTVHGCVYIPVIPELLKEFRDDQDDDYGGSNQADRSDDASKDSGSRAMVTMYSRISDIGCHVDAQRSGRAL